MLARIGGHTILANPKHAQNLPDGITVLNQLAALPAASLEQLIAHTVVSTTTTLAQARAIVAEYRVKKAASHPSTSQQR